MSNQLSVDQTGQLIWGLSCLFNAGCLITYDGCFKKDIRIISGLFITFLTIQFISSTLFIVNETTPSIPLLYVTLCIFTFGGNIYLTISSILFLSPLHKNKLMRYFIICVLPIIWISFIIILFFIGRDEANEKYQKIQASYIYYIPCTLCIFMVIIIMCRWYKRDRFIFAIYNHSYANLANGQQQSIHNMANWSILFGFAVFSVVIGLFFNFIYPIICGYDSGFIDVGYKLIPDSNPGFTVRIINSLIVIPFITPLIRNLDKVLEYSMYRVFQQNIIQSSILGRNRSKQKDSIMSEPSDLEQEPLRE